MRIEILDILLLSYHWELNDIITRRCEMLKKICPCLAWILPSNEPTRKGYEPRPELEEEQFMAKIQTQAKHLIATNELMRQEITIEQQIDKTLGITSTREKELQYHTETQPQPIQQKEQQVTQSEPMKPQLQNQTKSYGFSNLGELQLNIPEYGTNYQLLKQKSYNAAELLDLGQNCTEVSLASKLKINKTKLRVWRKETPNCFIIQYELPCSYAYYVELNGRKITPKDNNKLIRQCRLVEALHQNLTLRYICMNKIGMLQPREFTYLKYTNNSSTNPSGHWQLCISKDQQAEKVSTTATKPGRLFSVAYIIEEQKGEGKSAIRIRNYVNLDIGVTVEKVWERILNESKAYFEEIWEEAANNYSDELV